MPGPKSQEKTWRIDGVVRENSVTREDSIVGRQWFYYEKGVQRTKLKDTINFGRKRLEAVSV